MDRDGWGQAGGGVEYALGGGLTINGEYIYTSLEADSPVVRVGQGMAPATNPFVLAPNITGTDMIRSNGRFGAHQVRIGMTTASDVLTRAVAKEGRSRCCRPFPRASRAGHCSSTWFGA